MKTLLAVVLLSFLAVLSCSADTISFLSDTYGTQAYVPQIDTSSNIWIGPYNLSDDGNLIVGTYFNWKVLNPASWEADWLYLTPSTPNVVPLQAAEWLNLQFSAGLTDAQTLVLHEAIWGIFTPGVFNDPFDLSDPVTSLIHQAYTNAPTISLDSFVVLEAYTYFDDNGAFVQTAQDFLVNTPEPTTFVLFGIGGILIAGACKFCKA